MTTDFIDCDVSETEVNLLGGKPGETTIHSGYTSFMIFEGMNLKTGF